MPTVREMQKDVARIVQDKKYSPEMILRLFNKGLREIASWNNQNPQLGFVGNILLQSLEASSVVKTQAAKPMVELPVDYGKNLYRVTCQGISTPIRILHGMDILLDEWSDYLAHEGPVQDVTVVGSMLYYQPVPQTPLDLTLYYYKNPPVLTEEETETSTNIPTCLPDHLHEDLLVNYAAKEILNEIEDGIEGQKVNLPIYEARYQKALAALYNAIPHKSPQRIHHRRQIHWF